MSQKILNKRSSVFGKTPLPSQIEVGEIAINFNHENPFLSILDSNGEIQKFLSETKTRGLIQDAKEDIDNSFYSKEEINNMFEAFDPSGEVDLNLYYTKVESDSKYQPKGNYLTEHQSLENYYTKSEADNKFLTSHQDLSDYAQKSDLDDYLTIASASTTYATKEELEEHIPTVDAYTKAETDTLLAGKASSAHTHDYETLTNKPDLSIYLTEHQDISGLATKQELEDYQMKSGMSAYLLASEAQETYQPKGTYVVPSDLNNYVTSGYAEETFAKKGDVPTDVYTKSETDTLLAGKASSAHTHTMSEITDLDIPKTWRGTLAQYNNLTEIDNDTLYIITDSSEQLVTSGDVESMISGYTNLTEVQTLLEGYSQTGHSHSYNDLTDKPTIPSVEGFATKAELENYQPVSGMSDYVTDSELNTTLEGYSTTAHTHSEYAEKTDLANYMPNSGMTDYALKSEIPNSYTKTEADNLLAGKANSAHTHTVSDITDLNIPSVEGLASEAWVSQNFSTTAHTHSDLATKAELDDYLTIASASTIYATKEELEEFTPSGDNYAGTVWTGTLSEYNNLTVIDTDTLYVITDANQQYVTSGQVENMTSGYTNLTEVQTLLEGYSTTSHTHSYNDLTDKPTIPSTTGLASETWVTNNFAGTGHTHSQYLTETSADTRYARVVSLTQAQYDALVQNDQVEQGVLYCIIEQSNS